MAKKKAPPKKPKSKSKAHKPATTKKVAQKAKVASSTKKKPMAKAKVATKSKAVAENKPAPKRTPPTLQASVSRGNQDVETVRLKPKSRVARAGTGAGDLQGISIVEDVDSESADELLEEGQAFEAGIVSGVERAGNEESEVTTHEVLEDDVPKEYDDDDRP
jgi:outer membrane biosynthesis protein TonB